jgi:plastocyanin
MKSIKLIFGCAAIFAMAFALAAGSRPNPAASPGETPSSGAEVKIDNFSFGPASVIVHPGTTITWTNHDDVPHVVASDDKMFKSKALDTDDRFSFTFTKPGTYEYFCAIHPKMTAKVVVQ